MPAIKTQLYFDFVKVKSFQLMKWLMIFILISNSTQTSCNLGCLSCNASTNLCELCDFQSFYFLEESSKMCKRMRLENCYLSLSKGKCLICKNNFAPDSNNICLSLKSTEMVDKCTLYFGKRKCAKCETNYYVTRNGENCQLSDLENVTNCEVYGENECLKCKDGFKFSHKKNNCVGKEISLNEVFFIKYF
jgi:hypothetical protein